MLFTRTIRRKLLLGAALVLGMLLILSASGITGLNSYRRVVCELDFDITQAPQPAELIVAAAALCEPLNFPARSDADAAFQQKEVGQLIAGAQDRLNEFRRRSENLPLAGVWSGQRAVTANLIQTYQVGLEELGQLNETLDDREMRADAMRKMQKEAIRALTAARRIPDPVAGVHGRLAEARQVYRSALVAIWAASAIVLILFLGLLRSGYVWIFDPIRKLHQGARRVAQGDFNYRVELKSRDEMAELADAFNKMTCRFQEIAGDLDRQVQERSRQLVRSERLAGVGFLAAGVAHEINNPLSAIAMAGESLEGRILAHLELLDKDEAQVVLQYLRMIQDESFRCKEITGRLLDFSRGRDAVRESTDLAQTVSEVVAMAQFLSKYREKKIEFSNPGPCYAEVNGPEIKQVILNLVANGLDAVTRGGTLRISLHQQVDQLVCEFTDDGCGMTADVKENLFEPFFTNKQSSQGTGLGLSISHRIISQHGGTISATSPGPGLGSTFSVRLPRQAQAERAVA
ncbi:MAG TPA: HAMP domain-containing sensor histidine kinase [Planctomycetaceae bacterium]